MKALYEAIKARIEVKCPQVKFVHIWNNQLQLLNESKQYLFEFPAVFIQFGNEMPTQSIGNNVKIYDPLEINIHICDFQLDSEDGNHEQNFDVFTLKQDVYKALQLFQITGSGAFDKQGEQQDYEHGGIYHYIQRYMTSYIENDLPLPIGGTEIEPPLTSTITATVD